MKALKPQWVLPQDWDFFISKCSLRRFDRESLLIAENDVLKSLFWLESGRLHVFHQDEWVATVDEPGAWVGELAFFSGKPSVAQVIALPGTLVWEIPHEAIKLLDETYQGQVTQWLTASIWAQLREKLNLANKIIRKLQEKQNMFMIQSLICAKSTKTDLSHFYQKINIETRWSDPVWQQLWQSLMNRLPLKRTPGASNIILANDPLTDCDGPLIWVTSEINQLETPPNHLMGVMIETPLETHRSQIWQEWLLLLYYFCQNESLNPHYHLMGFNENQLQWRLQVSSDRNKVIDEMIQNLAQQGLRRKFLESLQLVAEEWLMNAFYDAPVSFEGYSLYNHKSRQETIYLQQPVELQVTWNDWQIALSVKDPFGSLKLDTVLRYLWKNQQKLETQEPGKAGAGKGLYISWQMLDQMWVRVDPGISTQFLGIINTEKNFYARLKPSAILFQSLSKSLVEV